MKKHKPKPTDADKIYQFLKLHGGIEIGDRRLFIVRDSALPAYVVVFGISSARIYCGNSIDVALKKLLKGES